MTEAKKVNHNNIFESYLGQDLFIFYILEKIAGDWKTANRKMRKFNRENFSEFIYDEFLSWIENTVEEFCDEEFGYEEEDD